ncbi:hypothetical protein DC3_28810 [Deinococcus cellulosilyticus NBRC 106333 = KACC 11606]|uniref:Beta-mannosidase n=2 Tax=Deinococcus cellulosilyticus TaxID=401558 RepID=A0A511N4A1_DEIC1|nr:hypothetical protein DC3_28810 [Deinococcus cellulosilyticus NBRC 106333 = KACC 11606]
MLHIEEVQQVGAFARTRWSPAQVPGSIHEDLLRAGQIEDPSFGLNSLNCEWVSERQWVYRTRFTLQERKAPKVWLCFEGIDDSSDVFVDGVQIGSTVGAHTPHRFDLSHLEPGNHLLVVVLKEPPKEHGQLGRTSETQTLKGRFGYWWDFGTRLIHAGIWKDVFLEETAETPIWDAWATSKLDGEKATVTIQWDAGVAARVRVTTPSGQVLKTEGTGSATIEVLHPELWWPHEFGDQKLYTVLVEDDHQTLEFRHGIRSVTLEHNEASRNRGALPYTLVVNGQAIEMRGFNVVSADHLLARQGIADTERTLMELARHTGANMLRFNGVCPIASKATLEACDRLGLMVWQEMPLSSSGTDNVPPTSEVFLQNLDRDLPHLVSKLRNHPSVVLYDAGNELTDEHRNPAGLDHPTIHRIHQMLQDLDPTRPFLPTSPSGPSYDLSEQSAADQHDVHGPWHYRGCVDTYLPFYRSRALLHSEFGCQAAPRMETLKSFLPESHLWPMNDSNEMVVHHGSWWLMGHRIEEVFGPVTDLDTYVKLTQFVQHDVLRYAVLSNRVRPECSGALVWQLNEPWPNAHCTNVLDHNLKQKAAFYALKDAFQPEAAFLRYQSPVAPEGVLKADVLTTRQTPANHDIRLETFDLAGHPLQTFDLKAGDQVELSVASVIHVRLSLRTASRTSTGEYYFSSQTHQPFKSLLDLEATPVALHLQGEVLRVRNTGTVTAHFVTLEADAGCIEWFSEGVMTLLPGETRAVQVKLTTPSGDPVERPQITVKAFNLATPEEVHA